MNYIYIKERELAQTQQQLRSSEALVADFQKTLQQRDSELETLRSKVNLSPNSQCMSTTSSTPVTPPSILRHRALNLHLPRPGNSPLSLPLNHNNRY